MSTHCIQYVIVWAFRPRTGCKSSFENTYGPEGAWEALFRTAPGYLGTQLLTPTNESDRYLVIDRWESPSAYENFRKERQAEYDQLDRACETLTVEEVELGRFVMA